MTEEKKIVKKKAEFDQKAYETFTELTFEKELRKQKTLKKEEQKAMDEAKPIAYGNPGKKAMVTRIYRIHMQTIKLVEGLPQPDSVVKLFSEDLQKKIFQ